MRTQPRPNIVTSSGGGKVDVLEKEAAEYRFVHREHGLDSKGGYREKRRPPAIAG